MLHAVGALRRVPPQLQPIISSFVGLVAIVYGIHSFPRSTRATILAHAIPFIPKALFKTKLLLLVSNLDRVEIQS